MAALLAPQASAQEVPHGTIAYSNGKAIFTISADGSGKTKLFKKKGMKACCPKVSPDGLKVAFNLFKKKKGPAKYQMAVANLVEGKVAKLAGPKFNVGIPEWSPDGSQVAFSAYGKKKRGVWVAGVNAKGKQKVANKPGEYLNWNHDGTKLAFADFRKGKGRIWYHDFDTGELYRLPSDFSMDVFNPQWSPTEDQLLFQSYQETEDGALYGLHIVDDQGQTVVDLSEEGESVSTAFWAPNGMKIAFGSCCLGGTTDTINSIDPDGANRQTLATDTDAEGVESYLFFYGYSPDGSKLAYEKTDYDAETFETLDFRMFTMNEDGTGNADRLVIPNAYFHQWAPDSEAIAFCTYGDNPNDNELSYLLGEASFFIVDSCDADWGP